MNLNRVCRLADFRDPALIDTLTAVFPEHDFSKAVFRKAWEVSMALRTLRAGKASRQRILGVGAGNERTLYALTLQGEVHATDLYASPGVWAGFAPTAMLISPAQFAPPALHWKPEHLVVQHMDARALRYPDAHFDAVFSSSSIEHFGEMDDIAAAAREIGRVLKPGGKASISTEWKLNAQPGNGWQGVTVFDLETLVRYVIEPSGLELVDELDTGMDAETLATTTPLTEFVQAFYEGRNLYPDVVLTEHGYIFTSIHLALRKPL